MLRSRTKVEFIKSMPMKSFRLSMIVIFLGLLASCGGEPQTPAEPAIVIAFNPANQMPYSSLTVNGKMAVAIKRSSTPLPLASPILEWLALVQIFQKAMMTYGKSSLTYAATSKLVHNIFTLIRNHSWL